MAIDNTESFSGPFLTNGATTVFPFTFVALVASDVAVMLQDDDGVLTEISGFTVAIAPGGGGSVTFAVPPASGFELFVLLEPGFTQQISFENGSAWLAEPVNEVADRSAMRDLWLKGRIERALMVPFGEVASTLPAASQRAGNYLAYDADGNPIAASGTGADAGLRSDLAQPDGKDLVGGLDTMAEQAADDVDISGGRVRANLVTTAFERPGFANFGSQSFPTWSAALAAHRCGELFSTYDNQVDPVGDLVARIAILSNSVGRGVGTNGLLQTNLLVNAWPTVLGELLSLMPNMSAQSNGIYGDGLFGLAGLQAADPRISFDAGWISHPSLIAMGGYAFYDPAADTSGAELSYDPGVPTDTLDVYAVAESLAANFIVTVGGFFVGSGATDGPANVIRYVIDRSTPHEDYTGTEEEWLAEPWVIRKAAGFENKNLTIAGVEAYTAAARKISIANMSMSGGRTDHFATGTTGAHPRLALRRYGPHLGVIAININNCAANTPKATFMDQYQVMIDAVHRTGDVLLVVDNPVAEGLAPFDRQLEFAARVYELAGANSNDGSLKLPVVNLLDRWVGEDFEPNRAFFPDGVHPAKRGARGDIAPLFANVIGNPGCHFA